MESSDAIEPFPELPFELICLIIEKMLEIEPQRAPELACLSRDIQPMVERALYRCFILRRPHRASGFFVDMLKTPFRPYTFYRDNVKILCIAENLHILDLYALVSACSGIQQLGIYLWYYDSDMSTDGLHACIDVLASSGPRPSKLACDYDLTLRPDDSHRFGLSLFENVTHLQLNLGQELTNFDGKQLHAMKNLTHLALADTDPPEPLSQVKSLLRKLHLADPISVATVRFGAGSGSFFPNLNPNP
ncbi:hypothetical protein C8J56DRAFT_1025728 [Mycena floridula]|nr:hypothetical protein C8J56DRAFT_1025728 [Mycena floridula]